MFRYRRAVVGFVSVAAFACGADTFAESDSAALFELQDQAGKLMAHISLAQGMPHASAQYECMTEMENDLMLIYAQLEYLRSLVSVSSRMLDARDEASILKVTKVAGGQALNEYSLIQGDTDHVLATCASNKLVTDNAHKILDYLDSATLATSTLVAKIQ